MNVFSEGLAAQELEDVMMRLKVYLHNPWTNLSSELSLEINFWLKA
jgi:hypothetical protein